MQLVVVNDHVIAFRRDKVYRNESDQFLCSTKRLGMNVIPSLWISWPSLYHSNSGHPTVWHVNWIGYDDCTRRSLKRVINCGKHPLSFTNDKWQLLYIRYTFFHRPHNHSHCSYQYSVSSSDAHRISSYPQPPEVLQMWTHDRSHWKPRMCIFHHRRTRCFVFPCGKHCH